MNHIRPILLSLALAAAALLGTVPVAAQTVTTTLVNFAPTITSVTLDDATLDPTAGDETSLLVTVVVADDNGFLDIPASNGVTVGVLDSGAGTFIAQSSASFQSGSGLSATFTKSLDMNFYDPAGTYTVKVVTHDILNLVQVQDTSETFTYSTLVASSAPSSLSLGTDLDPGEVGSPQSLTVTNTGNSAIDMQVSGTTLNHATEDATIAVSALKVSLAAGMTSPTTLSGSAQSLTSFSLARGASSTKDLHFQITVPSVAASPDEYLPAGTYTGTLTLTAIADT